MEAHENYLAAAVAILDSVTMDISAMHNRILELERGRADKKKSARVGAINTMPVPNHHEPQEVHLG